MQWDLVYIQLLERSMGTVTGGVLFPSGEGHLDRVGGGVYEGPFVLRPGRAVREGG